MICPSAYQSQLLESFIDSVHQPVLIPTFRCHSMWLRDIALRPDPSSCLTWAIRAISISYLGRKTFDPHLIETSRRIYGRALLKLNSALQNPLEGLSSDTLSATILLSFYEVFNCTDHNSWIKHAGGAGHLIRLRGPDRHRTGIDRTVFMACRYSLIMEAFQSKTACFLEKPEWRSLCWYIHNDLKRDYFNHSVLDANEEFFQEIVGHPSYLRSAIRAVSDPSPNLSLLRSLFATGHSHRRNYQAIHAHCDEELRASGQAPTQIASTSNDTTFPIVYDYRDIHIASLYCGYWAVLSAINISLIGLEAKLIRAEKLDLQSDRSVNPTTAPSTSDTASPNTLHLPHLHHQPHPPNRPATPLWDAAVSMGSSHLYIAENATYAREICRSVEYMSQAPFIGPLFLVMGLRMAIRMGITRPEKQWVLYKLDQIGQKMRLARSEIDVYRSQRGEATEVKGRGEAPSARGRKGAGRDVGAGVGVGSDLDPGAVFAAQERGQGLGMIAYVEIKVLERDIGSGVEMPAAGVTTQMGDDFDQPGRFDRTGHDNNDGEEDEEGGLDRAGPPILDVLPPWEPPPLDPDLAARESTSVSGIDPGGFGWGDPPSSGYNFSEDLVSETNAAGPAGGMEGAVFVDELSEDWNASAGQWKGDGGVSGL